jgi:hypothetical protein
MTDCQFEAVYASAFTDMRQLPNDAATKNVFGPAAKCDESSVSFADPSSCVWKAFTPTFSPRPAKTPKAPYVPTQSPVVVVPDATESISPVGTSALTESPKATLSDSPFPTSEVTKTPDPSVSKSPVATSEVTDTPEPTNSVSPVASAAASGSPVPTGSKAPRTPSGRFTSSGSFTPPAKGPPRDLPAGAGDNQSSGRAGTYAGIGAGVGLPIAIAAVLLLLFLKRRKKNLNDVVQETTMDTVDTVTITEDDAYISEYGLSDGALVLDEDDRGDLPQASSAGQEDYQSGMENASEHNPDDLSAGVLDADET